MYSAKGPVEAAQAYNGLTYSSAQISKTPPYTLQNRTVSSIEVQVLTRHVLISRRQPTPTPPQVVSKEQLRNTAQELAVPVFNTAPSHAEHLRPVDANNQRLYGRNMALNHANTVCIRHMLR